MKQFTEAEVDQLTDCQAPGAQLERDNLGQILIYTGIFVWSDGTWRDCPETDTHLVENAATAIEAAAQEWENSHNKTWGPTGRQPDHSMVKVGKEDAEDLREVAKLLREGKLREARNKAASLDTIVRDELPESFFRVLEENRVQW